MNISFKSDSPYNSVIVDTNTGARLYDVNTPWKLTGRITTIRRLTDHSSGGLPQPPVSQIQCNSFSPDLVSVDGRKWTTISSFLVRRGLISRSRTFVAPNGKEYKWKLNSNKFTLIECKSRTIVALSHNRKLGLLSGKPRDMNIDIRAPVIPYLDIVVLTFIIMEKKKRENK